MLVGSVTANLKTSKQINFYEDIQTSVLLALGFGNNHLILLLLREFFLHYSCKGSSFLDLKE